MANKIFLAIGGIGTAVGLGYLFLKRPSAPPISPAELVVSDLIIEPAQVYVGEPVTVSVIVTNIGDTRGTYSVVLEVT